MSDAAELTRSNQNALKKFEVSVNAAMQIATTFLALVTEEAIGRCLWPLRNHTQPSLRDRLLPWG